MELSYLRGITYWNDRYLSLSIKSQFVLLNKFERISISVCNQQFKTSDSDKHVELDKNLIFPENKHNINEKADKISKAMLYYLEKLNERGNLICFYEFF